MYELATERPEDAAAIEDLLDLAFGAERRDKASYRYRDGVGPDRHLCLVARVRERVVGSIRYWPVAIGEPAAPALLLGPLAVAPALRGRGVGAAMIHRSLEMALWARHRIVVLVGDRSYYRRFGFAPAAAYGLSMPGEAPHRLLARELAPNALAEVRGAIRPGRRDFAAVASPVDCVRTSATGE